ncbi:MAG: LacI family transcriptional [Erysipelotrichaceae bacterium]|nr:MAG: LacI family transcriptional [Erysipelotrichaceae bacterium]
MKPTIKDVAKKSGFSITSVSQVLNNKPNAIPNQSKAKIIDAAKELNYRPNRLAVSLVTKSTKVLGLVIPDNSNLFFSELSKSIEVAARKKGYSIIYGNTNNESFRDIEYLHLFVDLQVDGIIVTKASSLNVEEDIENLSFLENVRKPYVIVDRPTQGIESNLVYVDNVVGGELATQHLLDLGHTKIGCFTGPHNLVNSELRLEGYKKAIQQAGLDYDPRFIFEGNFSMGLESAAMDHFLKEKVSAVFCFNDIMAFGLYREAAHRGINIPNDLSIVGYDNVQLADIVYPGLSTIHQPIDEIGEEAVKMLATVIEETKKDTKHIQTKTLKPTLVLRGSTRHLERKSS